MVVLINLFVGFQGDFFPTLWIFFQCHIDFSDQNSKIKLDLIDRLNKHYLDRRG